MSEGRGEAVDYLRKGQAGEPDSWETRFFIRESEVAGRGLFAARDYAPDERITVYEGQDLGAVGTVEGLEARAQRTAVCRADHIMIVNGKYIDGRHSVTGAQYINTANGVKGVSNNALFAKDGTGTVRVNTSGGIRAGEEILFAYGQRYWSARKREARERRRDERVGGMVAYSVHRNRTVMYVEEICTSATVRGRQLQVGSRLLSAIMEKEGGDVKEIHLIEYERIIDMHVHYTNG